MSDRNAMKTTGELDHEARCGLCGGTYDSYRRVEGALYYHCAHCKVYFLHPQPSGDVLAKFYSIMHENYSRPFESYDSWEPRLERDFAAKGKLVRRFMASDSGRPVLLDWGCAYGTFLKVMSGSDVDVCGFDTSESAVQVARTRLPEQVRLFSRMSDLDRLAGTMDAVTMWATIEHVTQPDEVLKAAARLLKPGGVLLLDTGLTDDPLARRVSGNVQWFDAPQHLWVFTNEGMIRLLQEIGLNVVHVDGAFERSMTRRLLKRLYTTGIAAGTRLLNRFVTLNERKIPCGNTGLWVARKKS